MERPHIIVSESTDENSRDAYLLIDEWDTRNYFTYCESGENIIHIAATGTALAAARGNLQEKLGIDKFEVLTEKSASQMIAKELMEMAKQDWQPEGESK